jgi:ferredoxin-nitrite reductase
MNKIEEYKKEKDGLDVLSDIPRYAVDGWETITDGDKERLKWAGVFFRRQTPGHFMMRLRIPNGILSATQLRAIGEISGEYGKGFADVTTRQQIQLRWFTINDVPEIWQRLKSVDLVTLQTGMDNIRNVVGCPVAGLTPNELFDASRRCSWATRPTRICRESSTSRSPPAKRRVRTPKPKTSR